MNSLKLSGAIVAVGMLLSGCNSMSQSTFENISEGAKGSAAFRQKVLNQCTAEIKAKSKVYKENTAALMSVPASQVPSVYCTRFINGMASGRVTYADYIAARNGGAMPKVIKVLQGR